MNNSDLQRLERMEEHCEDVLQAITRLSDSYDAFMSDKDVRTAIIMYIAQIGELSAGLSEEFRKNEGITMPWTIIKSMRNLIVHAYHKIDLETIWETAIEDIPKVQAFCKGILGEMK